MAKFDSRKLAKRAAGRPFEVMVGVADGGTYNGGTVTLTGIKASDGLISVLRFASPTAGVAKAISEDLVDRTTPVTDGIVISGTIDLAVEDDSLLVHWYKF